MGLRISSLVPPAPFQRVMNEHQESMQRAMIHIASGDRIVHGGEDPAGLSISEKLKSVIRSQKQAQRNANDAISLVQVAEGTLTEIGNNIIRLKELAIQASSDTMTDSQRLLLDQEVQQLKEEVNRLAEVTKFNGMNLLIGKKYANRDDDDEENEKIFMDFQVGAQNTANDRISFPIKNLDLRIGKIGISEIKVADVDDARDALEPLDKALDLTNAFRSALGAVQNRLHTASNHLDLINENLEAANSRIRDADLVFESAELLKTRILTAGGIAVLSQANQTATNVMKLIG